MIKKSADILKKLLGISDSFSYIKKGIDNIDTIKVLNGNILSQINRSRIDEILENLSISEFKVFSQWGDDGIIQFLIEYLKLEHKTFIEFGVEDYLEANTRFLLINNNWKGLIIDGSEKNVKYIQQDEIYWKYDITAINAFVTVENINSLLETNGFRDEVGLLHIDIDGNDYWIWKKINCISPIIVIVEYNSVFGYENPWTIPYYKDFNRTKNHYSNLYFGSSLLSLCDLAIEKGYYFIGCNSNGNNAYFIRRDKIGSLKPLEAKQGYITSKFRESRDNSGNLTFLTSNKRLQEIKGLYIYNTRTNKKELIC